MPGCHRIKNYVHCRKKNPSWFDKRSFRVKQVSKNVKIVIGCKKGKWDNKRKRCKIGTRVQKTMRKV